MTENNTRQNQAKLLRNFRNIHRKTGALLFVFFFIISISGLLLGWKKHTNGILIPKTTQGTTSNFKDWLPIDSLYQSACLILHQEISPTLSLELDRIDLQKEKGVAKFIFTDHFWEIQMDGATGKILSIGQRHSDLIENIHDGSIFDDYLGTRNSPFKLIYTSIMGLALLIFTVTGFWLWYGPKQMRKSSK